MERAGGGRATEKVFLSAPLQVSKFFPFHLKLQMQRYIPQEQTETAPDWSTGFAPPPPLAFRASHY